MKLKRFLIALPALFLLAGCNNSAHKEFSPTNSGSYTPVSIKDVKFFRIRQVNVSLTVNQTYQLEPIFEPVLNPAPSVTYSSSDTSVVSVSSTGLLQGKQAGFAIITANCLGFSSETYVSVTEANTKQTAIDNINAVYQAQSDSSFVEPDYLKYTEHTNYILKQNGEVLNESEGFEIATMSKSNAYICVDDTYERRQGVMKGNQSYSKSMWLFYCTEELEVFICHEANGVRKWISVIAPPGTDRWGAIGEIMSYLFSNFFTILENQFLTVANAAHMKSEIVGHVDDGRGDNNGNAYGVSKDSYKNQVLDYDLQRIFGTPPSGGLADIDMEDEFYYYENYCRYFNYKQVTTYSWRNDSYVYDQRGQRSYDLEEKELYYPDLSLDNTEGWTKAKDIWEI